MLYKKRSSGKLNLSKHLMVSLVLGFTLVGCGGGGGNTPSSDVKNTTPVAVPGLNQSVAMGETVTLNGGSSYDTDGDTLTYQWAMISIPAGSTAVLLGDALSTPSFVPDVTGTYRIGLKVNDGIEDSAQNTVTVTATVGNTAPLAKAGPDQNVTTGLAVTIDGRGSSDVDGDALTYQWTLASSPTGSAAQIPNQSSSVALFTPDIDGIYAISLTVNDGTEASAPDTVNITATTGNTAPVANAGVDQSVATGATSTLDGRMSSDADGDALTYTWSLSSSPGGSSALILGPSTSQPSFTPDVDGTYLISLVVNDGTENSDADTVAITASRGNATPIADAGLDQAVSTGTTAFLDGRSSSDADGDSLAYQWELLSKPTGSTASIISPSTAIATITPDIDGEYYVRLTVNDGTESSLFDSVVITATTAPPPPPPSNDLNAYSTDFSGNAIFLGCWNCGQYDPNSIHNGLGLYGSPYGIYSIRNDYGNYGSAYSTKSACNKIAADPPSLADNTYYHGRLSINTYHTDSICNTSSLAYSSQSCVLLQSYCSN